MYQGFQEISVTIKNQDEFMHQNKHNRREKDETGISRLGVKISFSAICKWGKGGKRRKKEKKSLAAQQKYYSASAEVIEEIETDSQDEVENLGPRRGGGIYS